MCQAHARGPVSALVLASRSPQRREILERLGVRFSAKAPEVTELAGGMPQTLVTDNASRKARAVSGARVLGADTAVCIDDRVLGKPANSDEAHDFLQALSGRWHDVYSGICLREGSRQRVAAACTRVAFRPLTEREIACYVAGGEWRQRAGGYAIQGRGALLVEEIRGDFYNVVGLPVRELVRLAPDLLG